MEIKNYKIISLLGEGGMAFVYLVQHKLLRVNYAIKVLKIEYIKNKNIRGRFLSEAQNLARMSHSNIIKVTDLIEEGDTVAFVMEYVEGETLKDYLERKGKLNDEEIKIIFSQMLDAVGYVHSQNLVHRDIKPSNFMLDKKGKVKLLDFGIAKTINESSAEYTQTGTGVQMGTPMYMSPEQIKSTKDVDFSSDIYSLGVVLWQMVAGKKPYDIKTLSDFELKTKIVNEQLELTKTSWDTIIRKATTKEMNLRFKSCEIFLNEFTSFRYSTDESNIIILDEKTIISNEKTIINTPTSVKEEQRFPSVKIGNQIWMQENLNVNRFRNGDLIPEVKLALEWQKAGEKKQPAWCYYENNPSNGNKFGKLYNWYAVNDPRGLAPEGWQIPSDDDWTILTSFLGSEYIAGKKMKNNSGWKDEGNGNNESGFSAFPGGYNYFNCSFHFIGDEGFWWSSTEYSESCALYRSIYFEDDFVERDNYYKLFGLSVRCIKN